MSFKLTFSSAFKKQFTSLEKQIQKQADKEIIKIPGDPYGIKRTADIKKLQGCKSTYRLRLGDYRIIYLIDKDLREIILTSIKHRREIY